MLNLRFLRRSHRARRIRGEKGSALIEATLLAPWILFLFVGIMDIGFFSYGLIAVENATRIAAEYTSQNAIVASDPYGVACTKVIAELSSLPNISGLSNCSASPLTVTATSLPAGVDGKPATEVTVAYQGLNMVPIPGLLMGNIQIIRSVQMRVRP